MEHLIFDSWHTLARAAASTALAYVAMLLLLRGFGKRTLSKMNAFDFIVTIALGSSLASVALTKSISLTEGVVAFIVLMGMQYLITWLSVRVRWVKKTVTSKPALLLYKGELLQQNMKKERVTFEEMEVAMRENGMLALEQVHSIVLESTGELSVVQMGVRAEDALKHVTGFKTG